MALASVKAAVQGSVLAQAMDAEGKPDAATLEAARAALERALSPEAERPVLIVVSAQGVVGRYHVGQSNRIDGDLAPFPPLGPAAGEQPRFAAAEPESPFWTGSPTASALPVRQFDTSKAQVAKVIAPGRIPHR